LSTGLQHQIPSPGRILRTVAFPFRFAMPPGTVQDISIHGVLQEEVCVLRNMDHLVETVSRIPIKSIKL
jgi:hypothetical protein